MLSVSQVFEFVRRHPSRVLAAVAVVAVLGWAYGESFAGLVLRWWNEPDYVYGFLVIPFSVALLWLRAAHMPQTAQGSLWGLPLLGLAAAMRFGSAYFQYALIDPLSLVPCLAGITVLALGWQGLRWAWPSIAYLVFMVPLPGFLASMLSQPLQHIGATTSTYLLQTFGIPAVARGTVIALSQSDLGVEEACSGLRMLMLFLAVCTAAALVMHRDPWQRVVLVLSAVPIAVIANVLRITITGILYETSGAEWAEIVFHDLAGWLMMPLAVILSWLEMSILALIFRPGEEWESEWL
jgi:exosortase